MAYLKNNEVSSWIYSQYRNVSSNNPKLASSRDTDASYRHREVGLPPQRKLTRRSGWSYLKCCPLATKQHSASSPPKYLQIPSRSHIYILILICLTMVDGLLNLECSRCKTSDGSRISWSPNATSCSSLCASKASSRNPTSTKAASWNTTSICTGVASIPAITGTVGIAGISGTIAISSISIGGSRARWTTWGGLWKTRCQPIAVATSDRWGIRSCRNRRSGGSGGSGPSWSIRRRCWPQELLQSSKLQGKTTQCKNIRR